MSLSIHLKIVGATLALLGLAHAAFPRRFGWKTELARVSLLTRQMFMVHCFFIALALILMGSITMFFTEALLQPTPLSRVVLPAATVYWLCRLFIQFFIYDSALWRDHPFNRWMHILFSFLWSYVVVVYFLAAKYVWR